MNILNLNMLAEIQAARARIAELVLRTPVLEDPAGSGLRIKAEHLQRTGSFKMRGASNRVTIAAQGGARHVVTASSGNHGQAVACVASRLGIEATIVVPEDAATVKVQGIRKFGAAVEFCGRTSRERLERAAQISQSQGAVFVPPYDDPYVIAGQGTAGLEILEQAADVKTVYVPVGGGGLISGIAIALKESKSGIRVIGVEPELANDAQVSLRAGRIVAHEGTVTIADGLRTTQPGDLTFPLMQRYLDDLVTVSEAEIQGACRYLLTQWKQAVEPSGAVSVAAALRSPIGSLAVVSGGNIDLNGLAGVPAWAAL
jgi:threonine dehydratase